MLGPLTVKAFANFSPGVCSATLGTISSNLLVAKLVKFDEKDLRVAQAAQSNAKRARVGVLVNKGITSLSD